MVFINSEGRFNENSYLFDGELFKLKGTLSIYLIESEGVRMLVDTVDPLAARRFVKKIKEQGLYPIHKMLLTHSHFDHVQGAGKLKKLMGDTEIEVLASEKAVEKLQDPEEMNEYFSVNVDPIEDIHL